MTAKDKFLKSPAAKLFAKMVEQPEFEAAVDTAIMESMQQLGTAQDMESAASRHWRLEGVALLARNLLKLSTPEVQPAMEQFGQLKGNT